MPILKLMILVLLATISLYPQDESFQRLEHLRRQIEEARDMNANQEKMARYRLMVLNHKMNKFAQSYNKLANLHTDGGWDAVLARKVEHDFEELKKCEGWYAKSNTRGH